ncbi:DUF177 domain-containing protein [Gemmatimonadota bacterium]
MARLEQEGTLEIRAAIPVEDPSWEGTELVFSIPVALAGQAQLVPSGEVVVRLQVRSALAQECRRCLESVETPVEEDLTLVFAPKEEDQEFEDESVRPLPENASVLDLRAAIREEMILSQTPLALCRSDCLGLCPRCGTNRNQEQCQCSEESADPRWDALRALRDE